MARVAFVRAKFSSDSSSGMADARPEVRVRTTDCVRLGKVNSVPRAAAAVEKLVTPGVSVKFIFSSRSLRSCSPIADHIDKSPECSRATS